MEGSGMKLAVRALLAAVIALATIVPLAAAAEPVTNHYVGVSDEVWGPCPNGSVVYAHLSWDITQVRYPDRIQFVIREDATFTNSANGLSIRSFSSHFSVVYLDSSTDTGISGGFTVGSAKSLFVGAAAGLVYNAAGRLIYNADDTLIGEVGVQRGQSIDLCALEFI
jgi:hypothetical protein